jgi:hypothetical protein
MFIQVDAIAHSGHRVCRRSANRPHLAQFIQSPRLRGRATTEAR